MDIFDRLKDEYPTLSKGRKRIAKYILEHTEDAAFMTAAELGQHAEISESMVVRFADYLGYDGYSDMQRELRDELKRSIRIVERMNTFTPEVNCTEGLFKNVLDNELKNINATCAGLDLEAFDEIAEKMIAAEHIGMAAMRTGYSVTVLMQILLFELLNKGDLLNPSYFGALDRIKTWGKNDVIFAILFFSRNNYIERLLQYAKEKGCYIVVVTDSLASSVSRYADRVILAKADGALITMTSAVVVVNILLNLILQKLKTSSEEFDESMKEFEKILEIVKGL